MKLTFSPHRLIRNWHCQTIIFNIINLHRIKISPLHHNARGMVLDAGNGIRLQGYYSPQAHHRSKGLVLLIHGWMGHANSIWVATLGDYLYRHGYSIFRLNLRDHGNTHHLNPDRLYSNLLDETLLVTQYIAQLENGRPFYIVGGSLGGNFAARLACRHSQTPIPNLTHTIAINPIINLHHTSLKMDTIPSIYSAYILNRWRKSLHKKEDVCLILRDYDLPEITDIRTWMGMTQAFVDHYTLYPNTTVYFADNTITPEMIKTLQTPVTFISADDDPIIPVSGFDPFQSLTPYLKIHIQPYGAHIGFIDIFPFQNWICEAVRFILNSAEADKEFDFPSLRYDLEQDYSVLG